ARWAEEEGADAVALINSIPAMAIDVRTRRPRLGNITGGLSGPAIHPIAVRMVWEASKAVSIPLIAMGGIRNAEDALEFILAGATAVAVGTATFVNPGTALEVVEGLRDYCREEGIPSIASLRGAVRV
ncbi:MAG: nitronate monooxygenase, partial [Kiritimatiellia bacterium]|nr:nitronate monooxygenase [Kiritimatiellia bacterium]